VVCDIEANHLIVSIALRTVLMHPQRSWAVNARHVLAYHRGRVRVRYREGTQEIPISDKWRDEFVRAMPGLRAD
jgi:hypothetical protein